MPGGPNEIWGIAAVRALHASVANYIKEEMTLLDGTSRDLSTWVGAVADAVTLKSMLEAQLQDAQDQKMQEDQQRLGQEFLVTKQLGMPKCGTIWMIGNPQFARSMSS